MAQASRFPEAWEGRCTTSHDANGFATNDCAHTYSWDSAGNPLTESWVSGLGDICLYQTGLYNIVGKHWADSQTIQAFRE